MKKILATWIGYADLMALQETTEDSIGPVGQALKQRAYDEVVLLNDYPEEKFMPYLDWLRSRTTASLQVAHVPLSSPTAFEEIYQGATKTLCYLKENHQSEMRLTFHLSPGTPAMAAVWIILANTSFPAELIESSRQHGVRTVSFPFDLAADFVPDYTRRLDARIERLSAAPPPEAPEFARIVHRSEAMKRVIAMAQRVALHNGPVLIEGESGTGKELLARAIHEAGSRNQRPFRVLNCGAIPPDLIEGTLFGTADKFATGVGTNIGYFEASNGGTLFLDEVGELYPQAQIRLLRALQEKEIIRVGETKPRSVDTRIIAATNRSLVRETAEGRFREDLFFRLAVAVIRVPPLRDRPGDLNLMIDALLKEINAELEQAPGYQNKKCSASGRNLLLNHWWPGNVRELANTLHRACIWSEGAVLTKEDIQQALLAVNSARKTEVLNRPLDAGFSLPDLLKEIALHYITRALDDTGGNKTQAAQLLGLASYQTLTNWMKKYDFKR